MKNIKPLGGKSYGSIPHLLGSKLGEGDHHIHEGQHKICTEKKRDKHDLIIVQEKLDGSNVAIYREFDNIIALTRSGYLANTSKYEQHLIFDKWVQENKERFLDLLNPFERICGEWLAMAHGTKYNLHHEPFVAFDIMAGKNRLPYSEFNRRIAGHKITEPNIIHIGDPFPIEQINWDSKHGAEMMEGVIYRVERKGQIDFIGKFVRQDYEAGKYFEDKNNGLITWNIPNSPNGSGTFDKQG